MIHLVQTKTANTAHTQIFASVRHQAPFLFFIFLGWGWSYMCMHTQEWWSTVTASVNGFHGNSFLATGCMGLLRTCRDLNKIFMICPFIWRHVMSCDLTCPLSNVLFYATCFSLLPPLPSLHLFPHASASHTSVVFFSRANVLQSRWTKEWLEANPGKARVVAYQV